MIKNRHIIHMLTEVGKYWCVGAVEPTPSKSTDKWRKVTCKNCIRYRRMLEEGNRMIGGYDGK